MGEGLTVGREVVDLMVSVVEVVVVVVVVGREVVDLVVGLMV